MPYTHGPRAHTPEELTLLLGPRWSRRWRSARLSWWLYYRLYDLRQGRTRG